MIAKAYEPDPGWSCAACGSVGTDLAARPSCPECGERKLRELNVKEEMVRLAEQKGSKIEVVNKRFGGVGALLRYRESAI